MDAIMVYRVARTARRLRIPLVPRSLEMLVFILFNSVIPSECTIGKGTRCGYRGMSVLIHKRAVIGDRVMIGAHCVIGGRSGQEPPSIGSDVHIGANACILGDVHIGDWATIGAGAVVLSDVPTGRVAVGNPARLLPVVSSSPSKVTLRPES